MAEFQRGIQNFVSQLGGPPEEFSRTPLGRRLAHALLWTEDGSQVEQVAKGLPIEATRAYVAHQPAAVFLGSESQTLGSLLTPAASLAYQSAIHWGIVANQDQFLIFNSHWIMNGAWFTLPAVKWENVLDHLPFLEGLTPTGFVSGTMDDIALEVAQPESSLLSVDDALVERLDHWRDETLKYVSDTRDVDIDLQTAFAQLFVLRCVEDRNLARSVSPLSNVLEDNGDVNEDLLRRTFAEAQASIQSELFEDLTLLRFPHFVLAGIINDLYFPPNIKFDKVQYDFSWIRSDILGHAYEKYLSSLLVPREMKEQQLHLWMQPKRGVDRITVQKRAGVFYTPTFLVRYITERSLDAFEETPGLSPDELPRVGDFSCGSGSFLVAAVDVLLRRLRARYGERNWSEQLVSQKKIVGVDSDPRAILLARLSLWLRFAEEPDPLPLPRLHDIVRSEDSLSTRIWTEIPSEYDLILGNPPFISTGDVQDTETLRDRFEVAKGRFDYSYLFLELAAEHLKEKGMLGMVVPNRLFINRNATEIRDLITHKLRITTVVNFGGAEVFPGIQSYIGVLIGRRSDVLPDLRQVVRVVKVSSLPPRSAGAILYEADVAEGEYGNEYVSAYKSQIPKGSQPWLLLSESARRSRISLEENSNELASVAGIYQGIRTGANDLFILRIIGSIESPVVEIENGLGEAWFIEKDMLHPVVYGSEIRRYRIPQPRNYLLYPYRGSNLLPEEEIEQEYPNLFRYLDANRAILTSRRSIQSSGLKWYEIVRKREEDWLESPKLLVRDLAARTSFAIDPFGDLFIVGGTAVVPGDSSHLLPLLAYLNSRLADWYLKTRSPAFGSGYHKFEPQHLGRLPVPVAVISEEEIATKIASIAQEIILAVREGNRKASIALQEELDDIFFELTDIDPGTLR